MPHLMSQDDPPVAPLPPQLELLLDHADPTVIMTETEALALRFAPDIELEPLRRAFRLLRTIFAGEHPRYRASNTLYHNLHHATDTMLATARLLDGAALAGERWPGEVAILPLVAALYHDSGFIQETGDDEGSGAKYTLIHVRRSMDLLERHGVELGFTAKQVRDCRTVIHLTEVTLRVPDIQFPSPTVECMARITASADLIAQTAERVYLEKLLYLYHEMDEGRVPGFESEIDMLRKTPGFFHFLYDRLDHLLPEHPAWLFNHFSDRWGIDQNLYGAAMQRHLAYLRDVLSRGDPDPRIHLRRNGIAADARSRFPDG